MRRRSRQDRYGWRSDLRAYDPASSSPSGCVEQLHSASESRPLSTRIGSFVWRCLTGSAVAPFPHPAHRTGLADCPHPALGQDFTPSPTTGRDQAGSGVRARNARKGARVDKLRPYPDHLSLATFSGLGRLLTKSHRECVSVTCPRKILLSNTTSALSIKEGGTPVRRLRSKSRPVVVSPELAIPTLFGDRLSSIFHVISS